MPNREDYFNTVSSLSLSTIACDKLEDEIYLLLFTAIASFNHAIPSEYRNNILAKPALTKLIIRNNYSSNIIAFLDILPLFGYPNTEHIGGFIRQCVILNNILKDDTINKIIQLGLKLVYYYERKIRIDKGDRERFGILHTAEHVDLLIYLYNNLQHNKCQTNINMAIYVLMTGYIIPSVFFKIYNICIVTTYERNLPIWFDYSLKDCITNKVMGNYNSNFIMNPNKYAVKIYSPKLTWELETLDTIETKCNQLYINIHKDGFVPDICVGIASGGAFCVKYLSLLFKCEYYYVKSKTWSGNSLYDDVMKLSMYYNNTLLSSKHQITEISTLPTNVSNILLFDDSVATGKTITGTKQYLQNKYPNAIIKTAVMIVPHDNIKLVDWYSVTTEVPIFWPWGCELD